MKTKIDIWPCCSECGSVRPKTTQCYGACADERMCRELAIWRLELELREGTVRQ